ncbi:Mevalonyl-coenzyme A hydratase sidH [Penicillium canariense]|uniref:Mevalonyl-coenzyme A hydratase sidH n=1 Tax=Penicillium canariense TaxID=189055 RepID=A0A9W9I1N3_9EURO|nr:Mevalonyl-coenzyme A hydratase sidH [Penicillium canariense]KAJ5166191.1 Mevalonyl-coenzyme A hydratase sidH [Penicillium canariense]
MSLKSRLLRYQHFNVTFPHERVVQVTLNRPEKLNSINKATSRELQDIWELFDQDESLWVGIITGSGRAFCTGADLHEWNQMNRDGVVNDMTAPGLAGLPRRSGKKPIIAAVNGICMGGGFEMVANCDLVVAASSAIFSLPEAKRGIVAVAGCLPRLTRTLGLQRTMDLALTGRSVSAKTLYEWGLVSRLVDSGDNVAQAALALAQELCGNSPDSLIVGRHGIRLSWELGSVEDAVTTLEKEWYPHLMAGPNFGEGIQAYVEKRPPKWLNSKL